MDESQNRVLDGAQTNHIFPFFWQQGEDAAVLTEELDKIRGCGARGFCVEARPHPDFGGEHWWKDMDQIMAYARDADMEVWLLDDDHFPTGHANGAFRSGTEPLANRFLSMHTTDVVGPVPNGSLPLMGSLPSDAKLIGVAACLRAGPDSREVLPGTCVDLTMNIAEGWLRWSVPSGLWRIMAFFTTCRGNGKLDYFNILDSASVRLLIDRVYEPHYARYKEDFGKTFRGFFSDEPEFANLPGYNFQAKLGDNMPFIPWSGELQARLEKRWGEKFLGSLPALWLPAGPCTPHIRYDYMDETTRQLAVSFSGQLGSWCAQHKVQHIGHIIEDDNSHGRLGCSTGHYFRSLSDMGMAGIDVVLLQVMPELDGTVHQWVASDRDGEFFHYGLAKLGASLAHIDSKKSGNALCEIFGAFGWQEGVGLMKWLCDHMLSRGINHFVPHAFSPMPFPDADCPPHFYARGNFAQYPFFCDLMQALNREAALFCGGRYPAQVAVLYHADAEWAGEAMLFQKPVRVLLEHQMDCDVVPADLFDAENPYGMSFDGKTLRVNGQCYEALVIPGCRYLPRAAARFVLKAADTGFPVVFVGRTPEALCEETPDEVQWAGKLRLQPVCGLEKLYDFLSARIRPAVRVEGSWPRLRTYPYRNDGRLFIKCFNESLEKTVDTVLHCAGLPACTAALRYDAFSGCCTVLPLGSEDGEKTAALHLEPGESTVLIFGKALGGAAPYRPFPTSGRPLAGRWHISAMGLDGGIQPVAEGDFSRELPDLTDWAVHNRFNGTLLYETSVRIPAGEGGAYALRLNGLRDCAAVRVGGAPAARVLGSPCAARVTLAEGENRIRLELPLTPVWQVADALSSLTVLPQPGLRELPLLCRPD